MKFRFLLVMALPSIAVADFYISPSGNDSNPCSLASPCLTLGHTQGVVQAAISGGMSADLNVYLRAGTYTLPSALTFGSSDSGKSGHNVIWTAYTGEAATISAGTVITGWSLFSGSIYRANVGTSVDFRQLFVNGVHAQRARGASNPAGWSLTSTGYTAPNSTVAGYGNLSNVEIVGMGLFDMERCLIASASGTTITMQTPCWTVVNAQRGGYGWNSVSWVENAFELMASGYWYLDRSAGFLYYWPPGGSMSGITVTAPTITTPITFSGASNIQLTNITLSHSNWVAPNQNGVGYPANTGQYFIAVPLDVLPTGAAVNVIASSNIVISSMEFSNLGSGGILIEHSSSNIQITKNRFDEIAAGAVMAWDNPYHDCPGTYQETNLTISNNYVSTGNSFDYFGPVHFQLFCATASTMAFNEVVGAPNEGMFAGNGVTASSFSSNVQVYNNRVDTPCQQFPDCGAIYGIAALSVPGNFPTGLRVFANNVINRQDIQSRCIYMDNDAAWITVNGNVCTGSHYWLFLNTAHHVNATNNYTDSASTQETTDFISVSGTTLVTNGMWPAGALSVMCGAGVQHGIVPGPIGNTTTPTPFDTCAITNGGSSYSGKITFGGPVAGN